MVSLKGDLDFFHVCFLRFDCPTPYRMLDKANLSIREYETVMQGIQDSASLFEVNVPDFKLLKQCRRELRMLKVSLFFNWKALKGRVSMIIHE